jgi:hypothetical protein
MTPAVIEYHNILYAIFNLSGKIFMRRSLDDGMTWESPVVIFPRHGGVNGSLSLAIDGNDTLHLFFGQRISGSPDIHGMWHSTFIGTRWMEPEAIIKGPLIVDKQDISGFDPYEARAIVSQGNVILVTWQTDFASAGNGVWYSYKMFDFGEHSPVPLPTQVNINRHDVAKLIPNPTEMIVNDEYKDPKYVLDVSANQRNEINTSYILLFSTFIILIVLGFILAIVYLRTKRE